MKKNTKFQSGFTLVEVSLALLVVAVGMLGTLSVIPQGAKSFRDAREDNYATMVAQSVLSDVRGFLQRGGAVGAYRYTPEHFYLSPEELRLTPGSSYVVYRDSAKAIPVGRLSISYTVGANYTDVSVFVHRGNYAAYSGNAGVALKNRRSFAMRVAKPKP